MSDLSKLRISGTDYDLKDAQARSDITALNGSLENIYIHHDFTSDFVNGKFVYANVSKGSTLNIEDLRENSTYCHLIIPVHAGYVYEFTATTESGTSKRAYVLTDSNYVVLFFGDNGKSYTNGKITPQQDGYLVINAKKANAHSCTETYYPTGNRISALEEIVTDIEDIPDTVNALIPSYGVPFTPAMPYKYAGENIVPYKTSGHLADIYALYDALLAQYPQYMHKQILGMDASGQYELRAYYVDNGTNYAYRLPRMVWLASIHGNEGNTAISAYYMLKELLEKFITEPVCYGIMSAVRLYVIPSVNPWGVENYSRLNSNNVNLNRNFPADWVYRDPELASGTEKYGIMSASNGSNKYYYYGGGTCVYDDTTQTATTTYVAETETQIIMDFLNSINTGSNLHGKICFAVNKHDAGSMSEEGATIFIKDNYPSDRAFLSNLIDWFKPLLMGTQNWLTEKSGLNIGTVSYSAHGDAGSAGTMDKWYNAIGIHGCLCEIPKDAGSSFADTQHYSDLCAINVEFGLNLLTNVIVNNAKLKNNTQTEQYEIVT